MNTMPTTEPTNQRPTPASSFDQVSDHAYQQWREAKLGGYPSSLAELTVEIENPLALSASEKSALLERIGKANFAVFECKEPDAVDKAAISLLGEQLGLHHLDGNLCADEDKITSITVDHSGRKNTYIPYTNRPISWHTDGYYNHIPEQAVQSFILYCAQNASEGGTNRLMDHELAYIHLRDIDPQLTEALSHPNAMTIPANIVDDVEIRPEQTGPVFMWDDNNHLTMRYTARTRSIEWRDDEKTREATQALTELFASDHPGIFEYRLAPGQGVISNNILHMRTGFEDDPDGAARLFYRARYYQRIDTSREEIRTC